MFSAYLLNIDKNLEKEDFDRLLNHVSHEKKKRILRFHRYEDAQRSLLGDILSRYAICERCNIKNNNLVFTSNEYGKPLLTEPSEIHFNISHSADWVVCAVDNHPIGIDVETIKPIDFNIAERFFSKAEYLSLINQPEESKLEYFYMLWTLKESYIKAEGKGLSIPLDSFNITIEGHSINVSTKAGNAGYYFYQSRLDVDTIYAICTSNDIAGKIINWDIKQFIDKVRYLF
jgi:4'-phosphopantetheinyl transferase